MKFCPVVPEICHGQVHVPRKERKKERKRKMRRRRRIIIIIIIIIIRNGAKTISLQMFISFVHAGVYVIFPLCIHEGNN